MVANIADGAVLVSEWPFTAIIEVFWGGDQAIVVTHKFVVIHIIACP